MVFFIIFIFFFWSFFLNQCAHYLIDSNHRFFLFPYFECFMTLCFTYLWYQPYFYSYFILFSALGITIQTDMYSLLISRFVSLYLLPLPIMLSYSNFLPISIIDSLIASCLGYIFFYGINKIFYLLKKENGLGEGDFDLMAFIGAYTGVLGVWFTILCGSILGLTITMIYMVYQKKHILYIPFGPFLSLGAIIFILFQNQIFALCL